MIVVLTFIRLLTPMLVVRKPKLTIFLALLFDSVDYQLFPRLHNWYDWYSPWDKLLDVYQSIVFVGYISAYWQHTLSKKISYALLAVRLLGVVLFELTAVRLFLFLFPNVFDSLFIFVEFFNGLYRKIIGVVAEVPLVLSVMVLTALKFIQEYFVHVKQSFPWQWPESQLVHGDGNWAVLINSLAWVGIFLLVHLATISLIARYKTKLQLNSNELSLYILFQHFILYLSLETYDSRRTFRYSAQPIS